MPEKNKNDKKSKLYSILQRGGMDVKEKIKHLQGYQKKNMEDVQKIIDNRVTAMSNINTRLEWTKHQKRAQVQNEYDRIRNQLANSALPNKSVESIKFRTKVLRGLGAKSVNRIEF